MLKRMTLAAVSMVLASCASTSNDDAYVEKTFLKIQLDAGEQTILDTEVLCEGVQQLRFGDEVSEQAYIYKNFLAKYVSGSLDVQNTAIDGCTANVSLTAQLYADVSSRQQVNGALVFNGDYLQSISQSAVAVSLEQGKWQDFIADAFILSIEAETRKIPY
ncbi:hypothetical protein DS2_09292 [Catenovulum agarivorans DS-2]|uniref:Lipoprotein n=1 Tax=Catenovulum agarivorans DS-2 TaxID=1328313 RepID=W7QBF4_9ALTE|nr:hypothetical protein [Catenovulum agarivorans]EWH10129.1 hypothetical protein DS2_09292 [Catenovulum agarivorans DS-2]